MKYIRRSNQKAYSRTSLLSPNGGSIEEVNLNKILLKELRIMHYFTVSLSSMLYCIYIFLYRA